MGLPDVTPADIPTFYSGDLEDFDEPFLKGKLQEAADMIGGRYGDTIAARIKSGRLTTHLYKGVVVRVAARVFSNPDGYRKENEGGYGYEINAAVGSGTLWLTDDDILDLTGVHPNPAKRQNTLIGTVSIGQHRPGRSW